MKKFHEVIRAARYKSGLSLSDLSAATGLASATLCHIENGKMIEPSFRKTFLICNAIGLDIVALTKTEMKPWCPPGVRRERAKRMRETLADPRNAEAIRAGNAKGAKRLNKTMTPKMRAAATERAQESMTPTKRRKAIKKAWETRKANAEAATT